MFSLLVGFFFLNIGCLYFDFLVILAFLIIFASFVLISAPSFNLAPFIFKFVFCNFLNARVFKISRSIDLFPFSSSFVDTVKCSIIRLK